MRKPRTHFAGRCLQRYHAMPESFRIVGTALIGSAIGYITYLVVYLLNPIEPRATTSWLIAFLVNVSRQHALHRLLTFGHAGPYWPSLARAYVMYSGTALVTTALNWYLTVHHGVNHNLAWLACLALTGLISIVFLKRFVFGGASRADGPRET
jgi:putative flippase GtrA